MNTIRHVQGSWFKKRILTALLLGVCCLFYPHNALSQDEPGAPPQRSAAMQAEFDKGTAQTENGMVIKCMTSTWEELQRQDRKL